MQFDGDSIERRDLIGALLTAIAVNLCGASPALVFGADTEWFERPWIYPPEVLFPIVWTILFTLMGIAAFIIWRYGVSPRRVRIALGLFVIQLFLNMAWTPAFFGLQDAGLSLVIILTLWVAIAATIVAFHRVQRIAAWLLIPYLVWVTFATYLNYLIYIGG